MAREPEGQPVEGVPRLPAKTLGDKGAKRNPRATRFDWPAIRAAYVEGMPPENGSKNEGREWLTLHQVADRFGVSHVRIREVSGRERWPARRKAFQTEAAIKQRADRLQVLSKHSVDFDDKSLSVAKMGMAMVTARLAEIAEELRTSKPRRDAARARQDRGEHVEWDQLRSAINYKELDGISKAAQTFQEVGRRALGTDIDKVEITGADGGAIQVEGDFSIKDELMRDDPERLAQVIMAAHRAGITSALDESEVVEAELIYDEDDDTTTKDQKA